LPEVPAVAELPGLSDFRFSNWMLLMAPARTPAALVDKLASEVARLLQDKDTQQRLQDAGVEPMGLRGVAVQEFLQQERLRYAKVAQQRAVQFSE
jgi:tripartite-type tricarboxylate transporter receptor subunit TctC